MKQAKIEFNTLNVKILPPPPSIDSYKKLITLWFERGYRIKTKGDNLHYYVLTSFVEEQVDGQSLIYVILTKFVDVDRLDFVDKETGELMEYEIPDNLEARVNQYEMMFIPEVHRFALVRKGKINPNLKRFGAPLNKLIEVVDMAMNNVSESRVYVELEQSEQVFEDLFENKLLSINLRVSYTNDDHLDGDAKDFMDRLLKNGNIGEFAARFAPDDSGEIDSDSDIVNGSLKLAKENGEVRAKIQYDNGEIKLINTKDHPERSSLSLDADNFTIPNILNALRNLFLVKYR